MPSNSPTITKLISEGKKHTLTNFVSSAWWSKYCRAHEKPSCDFTGCKAHKDGENLFLISSISNPHYGNKLQHQITSKSKTMRHYSFSNNSVTQIWWSTDHSTSSTQSMWSESAKHYAL